LATQLPVQGKALRPAQIHPRVYGRIAAARESGKRPHATNSRWLPARPMARSRSGSTHSMAVPPSSRRPSTRTTSAGLYRRCPLSPRHGAHCGCGGQPGSLLRHRCAGRMGSAPARAKALPASIHSKDAQTPTLLFPFAHPVSQGDLTGAGSRLGDGNEGVAVGSGRRLIGGLSVIGASATSPRACNVVSRLAHRGMFGGYGSYGEASPRPRPW